MSGTISKKRVLDYLDYATDELAEVIADFDAQISPDEEEAYNSMRRRVNKVHTKLLRLSFLCGGERFITGDVDAFELEWMRRKD